MKRLPVFIFFIFSQLMLTAQYHLPVLNGYAYHQTTQKGVKPAVVAGENENQQPTVPENLGSWFIFLEFKKSAYIVPYRMWLNGKAYRVNNSALLNTPVITRRPGLGYSFVSDTLVAASTNKVIQVTPLNPLSKLVLTPADHVLADAQAGKVVVEYYWRAKRYSYTFLEIKNREALPLQ